MKPIITIICCGVVIFALIWAGSGPWVAPEMQECMQSHGSQAQYAAVLKKYCDPELIRQAMGLVVVKNPHVIKTSQLDESICYLVEGSIPEASAVIPGEATQYYYACWENGRLVSLDFRGGGLASR